MAYVRISILKVDYDAELVKTYAADPHLGKCPYFSVGDTMACSRHNPPDNFCNEAWKAIQHYVYALYYGSTVPFGNNWMKSPEIVIATCNDGLRPVTFKIERISE